MHPKHAGVMENSVDPDQTTPEGQRRSSLIWVYTVCLSKDLSKISLVLILNREFIPDLEYASSNLEVSKAMFDHFFHFQCSDQNDKIHVHHKGTIVTRVYKLMTLEK